jgi:Fe-S-cluster containining protein
MADDHTTAEPDLDAGTFSVWLRETVLARSREGGAVVPCGECTACCTSSQFVLIEPDETETKGRIRPELLFPAPGLPKGNVLLGYDEHGHCPMFVDGRCSIYEHRPRTCRTYDCRVFPAAGIELDEADKAEILRRTRRWRFDSPTTFDTTLHAAVQAAAAFLRGHARDWPDGLVPRNATQLAFLAIEVHEVFLGDKAEDGTAQVITPPADVVESAVRRARATRPP